MEAGEEGVQGHPFYIAILKTKGDGTHLIPALAK